MRLEGCLTFWLWDSKGSEAELYTHDRTWVLKEEALYIPQNIPLPEDFLKLYIPETDENPGKIKVALVGLLGDNYIVEKLCKLGVVYYGDKVRGYSKLTGKHARGQLHTGDEIMFGGSIPDDDLVERRESKRALRGRVEEEAARQFEEDQSVRGYVLGFRRIR